MSNAKNELLEILVNKPKVKCAKITKGEKRYEDDIVDEYILKIGHKQKDYEN